MCLLVSWLSCKHEGDLKEKHGVCTPADNAGRTGLANARRSTEQYSLLGEVFWLAAPLDLCSLFVPQVDFFPVHATCRVGT